MLIRFGCLSIQSGGEYEIHAKPSYRRNELGNTVINECLYGEFEVIDHFLATVSGALTQDD
jgi:hypothetical protein